MNLHKVAVLCLQLASICYAQNIIYSGTGFGTYYYDIQQPYLLDGTDFTSQNKGNVTCSGSPLSLDQIQSNYLVAMNNTQLAEDRNLYCGKQVIVEVNGVAHDLPLFIGDGCLRCAEGPASSTVWNPQAAPGLDFSYSVLSELSSDAYNAGHVEISWQILDQAVYDFITAY